MYVTARMLASEIGVSEKTILAHVRQMERDGYRIKAAIGRPIHIHRERFLDAVMPGWREEYENE